MLISELITTARADYLDDTIAQNLWDNSSLLRKFTEAERQACNRANLIYDDSTAAYCKITLANAVASYAFSDKITVIENIIFDGSLVQRKTKDEMDRLSPTWRTDSGMTGKPVFAVVSGRSIRFSPLPDLSDAGKFVYLEVYRLPNLSITADTQTPEIPSEYHRDLLYWVLHECYKKQDADAHNQERSDYFLSRFNQIFGDPVSAKVRQHQFESPRDMQVMPTAYVKQSSNFNPSYNWDTE